MHLFNRVQKEALWMTSWMDEVDAFFSLGVK